MAVHGIRPPPEARARALAERWPSAGRALAERGPGGVRRADRCTLVRSGVHRTEAFEPEGGWVDGRDSRSPRAARSEGRPAFGLGPIARVPTMAALARPTMALPAMAFADGARPGVPVIAGGGGAGLGRGAPVRTGAEVARARAFGLPNLRRNVCPHFFLTGSRGAIPIHAPHLLKALVRQDATTSRCQLRGGVHLEQGYVNDVCLSPRFNQCVFYEEDLTDR